MLQGERELVKDNRSLARFKLRGIEPQPAGLPRVEVTFLIDANGILNVTARDVRTGREQSIDVKPSYGLTDEEIERMLEESFDHAEDDVAARLLDRGAQRGRRRCCARRRASSASAGVARGRRGRAIERRDRRAARGDAGDRLQPHSRSAPSELNEATTPLAQRIMDGVDQGGARAQASRRRERGRVPMGLNWDDAEDIGDRASPDAHEGVDPLTVRFTDLHRWVTELDEFDDDPKASNEGKLEAIQMAWLEEYRDRSDDARRCDHGRSCKSAAKSTTRCGP